MPPTKTVLPSRSGPHSVEASVQPVELSSNIERGRVMPRATDIGCSSPDLVVDLTAAVRMTPLGPNVPQLERIVQSLIRQNSEQWDLEDVSHANQVQDAELAAVKRMIDRSNARRLDLIDRIDALASGVLGARRMGADETKVRVHIPDTLGQIVDRMSIAQLRMSRAQTQLVRDVALCAYLHLLACLKDVMSLCMDGCAVLPPETPPKIYRPRGGNG